LRPWNTARKVGGGWITDMAGREILEALEKTPTNT